DNLMKVQTERILPYNKISPNLYSKEHAQQDWLLVEEPNYYVIEPSSLIQKIKVWLKDQQQPLYFDLSINEILYNFNGQ
ncbi:15135_t:CDS:1, partial [Gigaspora margarita]